MTLEEQIKTYRKQAGLSQEKMAELIGVSRQAITKWENGTGVPDITNILAIANLFQISVDELLSHEKSGIGASEYIYESRTEYDIDGRKNFDLKLGGANTVILKAFDGEKIVICLLSNLLQNIQKCLKVKIDDIKNRIDAEVVRAGSVTEADLKEGLTIQILVPRKYLGKIELAVNAGALELTDIENEIVEIGGKIGRVTLEGNKSEVEIDSNLDMEIRVVSHEGAIELNQVSATSRITVPEGFRFRGAAKGIATGLFYERQGRKVEAFSDPDADNYIELNGMKSELIIAVQEV